MQTIRIPVAINGETATLCIRPGLQYRCFWDGGLTTAGADHEDLPSLPAALEWCAQEIRAAQADE